MPGGVVTRNEWGRMWDERLRVHYDPHMTETVRYAALLRGVNVGKAKRIAMADLRALVGDLGYGDVRTLLNSGNVTFAARDGDEATIARRIEDAIAERAGFSSAVIVVSRDGLETIVRENALAAQADNPSRLLVAFVRDVGALDELTPLTARDWTPERLHVGRRAAYLWCPGGVLAGTLMEAAGRVLGDRTTTRTGPRC